MGATGILQAHLIVPLILAIWEEEHILEWHICGMCDWHPVELRTVTARLPDC
jgi:hypothetical protein